MWVGFGLGEGSGVVVANSLDPDQMLQNML